MRIKFIEDTSNVRALIAAMAELKSRNADLPGLGLICGKAGLGKTQAVRWYSTQYDCPYIRATAIWTPRIMLHEICTELGHDPEYNTARVFGQVRSELQSNPRLIFIDEADYLTTNWKLLETLRDLHDLTGTSWVLVGMGGIKHKLAKRHQFWSRISQIVDFSPLSGKEIAFIAKELASLDISDAVAENLRKVTCGFFRDVMVALACIERIARANSRTEINKQMVDMAAKSIIKRAA